MSFAASANSELRRNHKNADNAPVIGLYKRIGFERGGMLRDYALRGGEFIDAVSMARLARLPQSERVVRHDQHRPPEPTAVSR